MTETTLPFAPRGLDVDDALAAPGGHSVGLEFRSFPEAVLGHAEDQYVRRHSLHPNHMVALIEPHSSDPSGRPAHGAYVLLVEADRFALACGHEDLLFAVGQASGDELVVPVQVDGDDPAGHRPTERRQRALLNDALPSRHDHELALGEFFDRQEGLHLLGRPAS